MKHKIVETPQGKVVVDETAELRYDDYYVAWEDGYKIPQWVIKIIVSGTNGKTPYKIIATINFSLDKDIPMIVVRDDIDIPKMLHDLWRATYGKGFDEWPEAKEYHRQKEAQQKGIYSEADVRNALLGFQSFTERYDETYSFETLVNEYIQSLNQEYIELEIEEKSVEDICKGLMIKDNWSKPYSHLWTKHNADKKKECWWVSTATDSFLSYLQSINLDMIKNYLLIQKL